VIDLSAMRLGETLVSVDLHEVRDLDIYARTVEEYEGLVRRIFPMLRLGAGTERSPGGVG
jgi:hypothetical protein